MSSATDSSPSGGWRDGFDIYYAAVVCFNIPMFILGIIQTVIGSITFSFSSNTKCGAFYCGVAGVITSLLSLTFSRKQWNIAYYIFVVLTCAICLIGCMVDGIYYAAPIGFIAACGNDDGKLWGSENYFNDLVDECEDIVLGSGSFDCYCIRTGDASICYHYDGDQGFDSSDCGPVTDTWGRYLHASWSLCLAMFFYTWIMFTAAIIVNGTQLSSGLLASFNMQEGQQPQQQPTTANPTAAPATVAYAQPMEAYADPTTGYVAPVAVQGSVIGILPAPGTNTSSTDDAVLASKLDATPSAPPQQSN